MKKRVISLLILILSGIALMQIADNTAFAADSTDSVADIQGATTGADVQSKIMQEIFKLKSGDTLTVTGKAVVSSSIMITIPDGVKIIWTADLTGINIAHSEYSSLMLLGGAGTFEIAGGSISIRDSASNVIAIDISYLSNIGYPFTGSLNVTGGYVSATSYDNYSSHTIGTGDTRSLFTVHISGGTVEAKSTGSGGAFALDLQDGRGTVIVSDSGNVTASSATGDAHTIAIYDWDWEAQQSERSVVVTGGTVSAHSTVKNCVGIYVIRGTINVSGGNVSATSTRASGQALYIRTGTAAYLKGTCTGKLQVSHRAIIAEIDTLTPQYAYRGTRTGITVKETVGLGSPGAVWDNTATSTYMPFINFTSSGESVFEKIQWGSYNNVSIDKIADFVTRLYNNVLNRTPDEEGLNMWTTRLATGEFTGSEIAYGFYFSTEFLTRPVSDEEYICNLYATMMDRDAALDDEGRTAWIERLEQGMSRDKVLEGFLNSQEYARHCDAAGIKVGDPKPQQDEALRAYVWRLYNLVLGREADKEGINSWVGRLKSGGLSGSMVAREFFFDETFEEYKSRGRTDEQFLDDAYWAIMGRSANDDEGRAIQLERITTGGWTRELLIDDFAASTEFINICQGYGIKP